MLWSDKHFENVVLRVVDVHGFSIWAFSGSEKWKLSFIFSALCVFSVFSVFSVFWSNE
jgi:hypothetical protein